ncbi:MAG: DUF6073 family protein [Sedimentisphaerales bacterium]|nr:DUF6073 family protein [Sedimentisphaerales bacterium]
MYKFKLKTLFVFPLMLLFCYAEIGLGDWPSAAGCLAMAVVSDTRVSDTNAVEVDVLGPSIAELEILEPGGQMRIVLLTGSSTVNVFFEGPTEGVAYDDNSNRLDEVETELVALDLSGFHPAVGPVYMRLRTGTPSVGMMEEQTDITTGVLDVPPFAGSGTADSFFDVFFELEFYGQRFYSVQPLRWIDTLTEKPPGPDTSYESSQQISLFDQAGNPTGFSLGATRYTPSPVVEVDEIELSVAELEIITPVGGKTVPMTGEMTMNVFFEGLTEGSAYDDDGDSLDEVRTELVDLDLSGYNPSLGQVHMRLRPGYSSMGQMEERTDSNTGILNVPPFTGSGMADSFFDIFFELEVNGQRFYNAQPLRWIGTLTEKPPGPDTVYDSLQDVNLYDANDTATGSSLGGNTWCKPNPVVEIDVFDVSLCDIELLTPSGPEPVELFGTSTMHVFFDGLTEGTANDDDGDSRDEVQAELVQLSLSGESPTLGTVNVSLRPDYSSMGQIEEQKDYTPGMLDLPPFSEKGLADSFFDVFFEIEVGGEMLYMDYHMRLSSVITEKPPIPDDIYEDVEGVELFDANGVSTGYYLTATEYEPNAAPTCGDPAHPYPVGDLNTDCEVNFLDFAMFCQHWLECTKPECD